MVSQVLQLLRQGVWAALTGGWYHDPEHSKFTNSCHLYLWLFLLLLPLALHLAFPPNTITVVFYCSSVAMFFAVIKLVSYRLHLMLDTGEVTQRRPSGEEEKPGKNREANRERTANHKAPSNSRQTSRGTKGEASRSGRTPPLHCSSGGRSASSHHSSGQLELPAQETVEDLRGVILAEDQPVAPGLSSSPGVKAESRPASKAPVPETTTASAVPVKPVVAGKHASGRGRGAQGQPPFRHRSEGGLVEKGALKKLPRLSLSQYDLLERDVSFQPWGSENSVLTPEPVNDAQGSVRDQPQSRSPQDSLSGSWPQCSTVIAKPEHQPEDASRQVDPPANQQVDCSDSEVAVTLIDTSQPGDPLSLHEPIKIVITMSSAPSSMTDLESSLHLKVIGTERAGLQSEAEPTTLGEASPPSLEQMRIPVITLELSEDGGGASLCPEGSGNWRTPEGLMVESSSARCSGYESGERGNATKDHSPSLGAHCETAAPRTPAVASESERRKEGQANLDPSSGETSQERRHARVLSVDSGTDVFLSKSSTEMVNNREKTMPTSKSDLEAKEGQIPNESNFLEFVSLLESISAPKVVAPSQRNRPAEPAKEIRLLGDNCSQEKKDEILESEKPSGHNSKPGKPDVQSQDHTSASPVFAEPAKITALFQGNRQRQIIYRVTSQQDSSVLQVISGPETSVQDEISVGAMHVFIDDHGEIRSCYLKSGNQKEGPSQHQPSNYASFSHAGDIQVSSSSTTTSESPDPPSGDPAVSALQQQLLLMVARRTQPETPRHLSQDLDDSCSSTQGKFNRDQFHKFIIFPGKWIKVWYDRLTLLALLDRTEDVKENVLAVSLIILVSLLGFLTLNRGFCKDLWVLLFCLVMASCQYSLLKSVQPDPASPIHGHNQIITYSRPIYFCVLCGLVLLLDAGATARRAPTYAVYGLKLFSPGSLRSARDLLIAFLYCFPAISLLGLFPQINTFCIYLLEQIDMLVFGGSAVSGMTSAVCSVARSAAAAAALHVLCVSAVKEPWSTQHIPALFSAFCGLLVSLSYHLSRQSSDPSVLLSFIQCRWFPKFLHQNLEELAADPLPEKMKDSVVRPSCCVPCAGPCLAGRRACGKPASPRGGS